MPKIYKNPKSNKFKPKNITIVSQWKGRKVKKNRKIFPLNAAPCIHQQDDLKMQSKSLSVKEVQEIQDLSLAQHHGSQRIMFFGLRSLATINLDTRTDPSIETKTKYWIGGADLQVGQASNKKLKKGEVKAHAAHCTAISGAKNNRRSGVIREIQQEKKVTPKKRKFLKSKGVSESLINHIEIKSKTDPKFVEYTIKSIWKDNTFLTGSDTEITLNATFRMRWEVNIYVDLVLERTHRNPVFANLVKDIAKGNISPKEGTKKYQTILIKHFDEAEKILLKRKEILKYYQTALMKCKTFEKKYRGKKKVPEKNAFEYEKNLYAIRKYRQNLVAPSKTAYGIKPIATNKYFASITPRHKLKNIKKRKLAAKIVRARWKKQSTPNWDALEKEILEKISQIEFVIKATQAEREGTKKAPLEFMFQVFDEKTKTWRDRTEKENDVLQQHLLKIELKELKKREKKLDSKSKCLNKRKRQDVKRSLFSSSKKLRPSMK